MDAINLNIYNQMAKVANRIFVFAKGIKPAKYKVSEINKLKYFKLYDEDVEKAYPGMCRLDKFKFTCQSFECEIAADMIFNIMSQWESKLRIPAKERFIFEKVVGQSELFELIGMMQELSGILYQIEREIINEIIEEESAKEIESEKELESAKEAESAKETEYCYTDNFDGNINYNSEGYSESAGRVYSDESEVCTIDRQRVPMCARVQIGKIRECREFNWTDTETVNDIPEDVINNILELIQLLPKFGNIMEMAGHASEIERLSEEIGITETEPEPTLETVPEPEPSPEQDNQEIETANCDIPDIEEIEPEPEIIDDIPDDPDDITESPEIPKNGKLRRLFRPLRKIASVFF